MTSEDVTLATLATVVNDIWGNDKVISPFDKSSLSGSPPEGLRKHLISCGSFS